MEKRRLFRVQIIIGLCSLAAVLVACNGTKPVQTVTIIGADSVSVGHEAEYTLTVTPSGSLDGVVWSVSAADEVGATITQHGVFRATATGEVTISAKVGNATGSKAVTVVFIEATSISVSDVAGVVGEPLALEASLLPLDSSNTPISYELIDNDIDAQLSGNMVVSEVLGEVKYRARVGNLVSQAATITFSLNPSKGEIISTAEQLDAIRSNLNGAFQLANDISLDGEGWTPIGTTEAPFKGRLLGNGYTISNLTISTLNTGGAGLFGVLGSGAEVRSLKVQATINASYAGVIAGVSSGTLVDCQALGSISSTFGEYLGGIVGKQTGGRIENCASTVEITGSEFLGGIVGHASVVVLGCINNGAISGVKYLGGIAGYGVGVSQCTNNAAVSGTGDYVGGILGYCQQGDITFSLSYADVVGRNYVGGAVGCGNGTSISDYTNANNIVGKAYVGGVAGRAGNITNCHNEGTITASGVVVEGSDSNAYVGGVAGYCESIQKSTNQINITFSLAGRFVGGLAGRVNGRINDCENSGNISSEGDNVGGAAGYCGGNVSRVINNGAVNGGNYVGGVIGTLYRYQSNDVAEECENHALVIGNNNVGGIFGQVLGQVGDRNGSAGLRDAVIRYCENYGNVEGVNNVGGISGYAHARWWYIPGVNNDQRQTISFVNCLNEGSVTGNDFVSGILGTKAITSSNSNNDFWLLSFTACENNGIITANTENKWDITW